MEPDTDRRSLKGHLKSNLYQCRSNHAVCKKEDWSEVVTNILRPCIYLGWRAKAPDAAPQGGRIRLRSRIIERERTACRRGTLRLKRVVHSAANCD